LTNVIREAKMSYHNQIINCNNRMKTMWDVIKSVSGRQNEHKTSKYQYSPNSFNIFFLTIAEKINHGIKLSSGKDNSINNPKYLSKISNKSFTNIKFNNTSTREIKRIIKSLKLKICMAMMKSLQNIKSLCFLHHFSLKLCLY
jgi:hypothetical protein